MNTLVKRGVSSIVFGSVCLTRLYSSCVPKTPIYHNIDNKSHETTRIDTKTIEHLEHLSLVDFANRAGIERLQEAIRFADQILHIDTSKVDPLITVVHEESLHVEPDEASVNVGREELLANASITEEEYFFAPPGNIPLPTKEVAYDK